MIKKILAHLLFLPNFFIPIGVAHVETFPHATLFSINRKTTLPLAYVLILVLFAISAVLTFVDYGQGMSVLRSYLAIVNATLIFYRVLYVDREDYDLIVKALFTVLAANIFIAALQRTGMLPGFLYDLLTVFIPRMSEETMGSGRGVTGLYPEPAYTAYAMHYIFAFVFVVTRLHPFKGPGIWLLALIFLWDIVITRSVTDIILLSAYLAGYITWKNLPRLLGFTAVLLGVALLYAEYGTDVPRSLQFVHNVFFTWNTDTWTTLINESGYRFVTVYGGYLYGLVHPLGGGIGSYIVTSVPSLEMTGIDSFELYYYLEANEGHYIVTRPSSVGSALFLEAGIIGTAAFLVAYTMGITRWDWVRIPQGRAVLTLYVFNFLFLGTIGDPVPAAVLALCYVTFTKFNSDYVNDLEGLKTAASTEGRSLGLKSSATP
jgi:hypothetical protein